MPDRRRPCLQQIEGYARHQGFAAQPEFVRVRDRIKLGPFSPV